MNTLINKIIISIILLVGAAFFTFFFILKDSNASGPFEYQPRGGQFSVVFPGPSKNLPDDAEGNIIANHYQSEDGKLEFVAAHWNVAIDAIARKTKLQLIDTTQNKIMEQYDILISTQDIVLDGNSVRYLTLKSSRGSTIKVHILLKKNYRVIMLAVIASKKADDIKQPVVEKYFRSLIIDQ